MIINILEQKEKIMIINFEPALECGTYDCENRATVASVEKTSGLEKATTTAMYIKAKKEYSFVPICQSCVEKMSSLYEAE